MDIPSARPVRAVPVERHHSSTLSYESFLREYVATNRPVVVEAAVSAWPALQKWTPEYFSERFADIKVDVSYEQKMRFADFIDGVVRSSEQSPGPYMYRLFIGPHLPQLLSDVLPQNAYAFPRRLASSLMPKAWRRPDGYLKLLMGGVGGRFPTMHYDGENMHAAITEIHGDKTFVLYSPQDTKFLYPRPTLPNKTLIADIDDVDPVRFPLFARATRYQTTLHPGDMIFVPSKWWHTARVISTSISVCQNMVDGSNWRGFVADVCGPTRGRKRWKQFLKRVFLTALGLVFRMRELLLPPRHDRKLQILAAIAPLTAYEAADPKTWPMHEWDVE
ncbi:MAG: cupin-like domain-containing protein [Rhodanobacteraceae bacterium]